MAERHIPGIFADVSIDASGAVWIVRESPARDRLLIELDGIEQAPIPGQFFQSQVLALYPQLDAAGPSPAISFQLGQFVAVWLAGHVLTFPQLGPVFATYPTAIVWTGSHWLLASITSRPETTLTISRLDLSGHLTEVSRLPVNTSQGIFSLAPDGTVTLTDYAPRLPGVSKLWTVGALTVGEGSNPDHLWGRLSGKVLRIANGFAAEPRHVQRADGSYVLVARELGGKVRVIEGPPWPAAQPGPSPASPPAPAPSTIAPVKRPAIWAYWKPADAMVRGNAILIEQAADLALIPTTFRPLIVLRQMLAQCWPYWSRVLAVLIHEEGGQAAVEEQARLARLAIAGAGVSPRDVMSYTGTKLYPSAKGVDIHGIQAYLPKNTPTAAKAMGKLIRAAAAQFGPKQRMVLHGQAYDRRNYDDPTRRPTPNDGGESWSDVEGLKAMQCAYPAAMLTDSRIVGCIWFCDGIRQGGTRDYPELVPYHARCVAVTPGAPPIPIDPPPTDPDPPVDPPVDPPEEPPVPEVKFPPMSDVQRAEVATTIENIYDTIYPTRPVRETRVDPLGYGRWPVDYLVARARGKDHAGGLTVMRAALFSAAGIPDPDPQ